MKNTILLCSLILMAFCSKAQDSTSLFQNFDVDDSTGLGGDHFPPGWTPPYHVVDGGQIWKHYTTFGKHNSPCVEFNGYQGGASHDNDTWMIAPKLNLSGYSSVMLHFSAVYLYAGDSLHAKVSTNYSGTGSPEASGVTWVEPNHYAIMLDDSNNVSNLRDFQIDLTPYIGTHTYVGFQYKSSSTPALASRWTLDSVTTTGVTNSHAGISNVVAQSIELKVIGSTSSNQIRIGVDVPSGNYFMNVYDMEGRNVNNVMITAVDGYHEYTITGLNFTKGMYVFKLGNESYSGVTKVIVQ